MGKSGFVHTIELRLRVGARALGTMALLVGLGARGWCAADTAPKAGAPVASAYADTVFEHLDQKSGLPGPVVQAVGEDGDGFVWVATENGVSRWDGYHFHNYAMQPGVAGALPENNVFTLYGDPLGRFWLGTKSRGVVRYDPVLDRFEAFAPSDKQGTYKAIYSLVSDGARGLWVGTRGGLDHLDPDTRTFTHAVMEGLEKQPSVQVVLRGTDGRVWVGTTKGLFRSDKDGKHFVVVPVLKDVVPKIWSLMFDHSGRLWIGTTNSGAFVLNAGADTAVPVTSDVALTTQGVDTITEAAPGVVWLGTYGYGIVSVDAKTLETHRMVHDASFSSTLPHDTVVALYRDRSGEVWAGTERGVSRNDPTRDGILSFFGGASGVGTVDASLGRIVDPDVTAVAPTRDGKVWLGFNEKGVEVFDAAGGKLSAPHWIAAGPKGPLPVGAVGAMAAAPDGSVFVGTQQWVYRMDSDARRTMQLPLAAVVASAKGSVSQLHPIHALLYDAGSLWIASQTDGLWKQDVSGAFGKSAPQPVLVPLPNPKADVTALARGTGNDLWAGTSTELFRYDVMSGATERIAVDAANPNALTAAVTSLLVDHAGRVWVTTFGGGICVIDGRGSDGQWQVRRLLKGLPNKNVDKVLEAADGNIWAATDNGLAEIDAKTLAIVPLQQADGVAISAYWVNSGGVAVDGRLMFGGGGGLTIVQPGYVKPWTYEPPVVVTEARIGGKTVPSDGLNELGTGPLEVRHEANSLEVDFAALDYTATGQNLYEYRLVGFDRDWVMTDSTRRTASYTNLPPGHYTLELRGSNRDGLWGETRKVAIHVMPAWFQTVWAKIAVLLLIALALVGGFRASTAYLRARQRMLERKVAERTAELEQTTRELEQSRQMMEQIAYTDSLTGLPNRRMFQDCFRRLLALKRREKGSFVLVLLDLDKFKEINDTHGHDAGDTWLKEVALRLSPIVRESDCFARLGGDEFAILLAEGIGDQGIKRVCEMVAASFTEPVMFEGLALKTTLSLGVAVYPDDGGSQEALSKAADRAMYRVKHDGGDGWQRYKAEA